MPRKNYREWYANLTPEQKEVLVKRTRQWQQANPDKVRELSKRAYERKKAKGTHLPNPRYSQEYKQKKIEHVVARKLAIGECFDCGFICDEYTHICFAFDHLEPELKSFSLSKAHKHSYAEIEAEITKCQLVCHNCHAIRTWYTRANTTTRNQDKHLPTLFDQ
jgi:hypothetical protein